MNSFEMILPFLRPIEYLIADEEVSEIMVNSDGRVFFERNGLIELAPAVLLTERFRQAAVRNIARLLGDDISEEEPMLDSRLPDGSRVAAVFGPTSIGGTILSIRKFRSKVYTAEEMVRIGSLSVPALEQLRLAVESRQTILISGGTGTGKTTLLNALAAFLPQDERIVLIEDTAEISLSIANLVRLEARRAQPDLPAVTIRDLLRQTLRLRPDRIILGEVRGAEAFDLLQALNTGHMGTISTIHANSAEMSVSRFHTCISMSGVEQSERAIARNIAEVVNVLVHIERRQGNRQVTQVLRIDEYFPELNRYRFTDLLATDNGKRTAQRVLDFLVAS